MARDLHRGCWLTKKDINERMQCLWGIELQ